MAASLRSCPRLNTDLSVGLPCPSESHGNNTGSETCSGPPMPQAITL
jgi:hypothetical protein